MGGHKSLGMRTDFKMLWSTVGLSFYLIFTFSDIVIIEINIVKNKLNTKKRVKYLVLQTIMDVLIILFLLTTFLYCLLSETTSKR